MVGDEGAWERGTRKRLASNLGAKDGEDARRLTFPESIDQLADIESSSVLEFVLVVEFHGEDVAVGLDLARCNGEESVRRERWEGTRLSKRGKERLTSPPIITPSDKGATVLIQRGRAS